MKSLCANERATMCSYNPVAVAVFKQTMLLAIYTDYFQHLGRPGSKILYTFTGHRKYSKDLPQGGMKVPCWYTFHGEKSMSTNLEVLLSENNQLSATYFRATSKTCNSSEASCLPVLPASPTTSICSLTSSSEHNSPMEHQNKTKATDNSHWYASLKETKQLKLDDDNEISGKQMWVKFGRIQLSKLDRKEIECSDWLTH